MNQSTSTQRLVDFLHFLRRAGFTIGVQETLDALRLLDLCSPLDAQAVRDALRSLLCLSRDEWGRFDRLFERFWYPQRHVSATSLKLKRDPRMLQRKGSGGATGFSQLMEIDSVLEQTDGQGEQGQRGAGRQTALARSDFRFLADRAAMAEMERLAERLARLLRRRLRRRQRLLHRGRKIHMRRTLRKSLIYGGLPMVLSYQTRRREFPRLIMLLDISHSMAQYSHLLARFTRGLTLAFADTEAFMFHTRLYRMTQVLRQSDVATLRQRLEHMAPLWMGGTRIADSLKQFNRCFSRRYVDSRSYVIIMSDGFDSDASALLVDELSVLRRRAKKILWLNPMLGREEFNDTDEAMLAILPRLDLLAPAHSVQSLEAVITYLARQ